MASPGPALAIPNGSIPVPDGVCGLGGNPITVGAAAGNILALEQTYRGILAAICQALEDYKEGTDIAGITFTGVAGADQDTANRLFRLLKHGVY